MAPREQLREAATAAWAGLASSEAPVVTVGTATCGRSAGALDTLGYLREETAKHDIDCRFVEVGCLGPCYAEPLVTVQRPGHATEIIESENNRQVWFELPPELSRYLFPKGYIGIDGISLTIGDVLGNRFNVNLIPETPTRTNLGSRLAGERVNIEIDPQTQAIVDTVERVLAR